MRNEFVKYKNIILFLLCSLTAVTIFFSIPFKNFIITMGNLGYIGVLLAGFFYVYTLSAVLGIVLLLLFSRFLPALDIALIAGLGAMIADYSIYYFSDKIFTEIAQPLPRNIQRFAKRLRKKNKVNWMFVLFGLMCLTLPIPDEIGISFMGLSQMSKRKFLVFAFLLNTIGIYIIVEIFQYTHIFL